MTPSRRFALAPPLLLLFVGPVAACGGASRPGPTGPIVSSATPTSAEAPVVDIRAMLAREATASLKSFPVSALDGRLGANVLSTETPAVKSEPDDEGKVYTEIAASIGSREPIRCWVYSKRLDAGGFVRGILQHAKGSIGVPEVDVTTHDDGPIVFIDVPMQVPATTTAGKPTVQFAMPKMAVAPRDDGTIACLHDEVGYRRTFRIFVKGLAASSSLQTEETPSKFLDVAVWRESGHVAGFAERRIKVKNGERLEMFYGAAVLRQEHDKWSLLDTAAGTATTLDGKVLRSDNALVIDGAMVSHMHMEKTAEGEFSFTGVNKGRKLEGTFKSKAPLTTELATAARLKSMAAGKAAEVRFKTFDDEKGGVSDVVFKRDKSGITKASGASTHKVEIDESGILRSESEADRTLERLLLKGSP